MIYLVFVVYEFVRSCIVGVRYEYSNLCIVLGVLGFGVVRLVS